MKKHPKLSILIPIYNEEELLITVVKQIGIRLKKMSTSYELILVENGSTDVSRFLINKLARIDSHISTIYMPNPDYGKAVKEGILKSRGRYVVIFSADWYDMSFLKKALTLFSANDIVLASKHLFLSADNRPVVRRWGSFLFHMIEKIFFGLFISDTHGLKVLDRNKILPIVKRCKLSAETFDTELIVRSIRSGLRIAELPVQVSEVRPSRVRVIKRAFRSFIYLHILRIILWTEFFTHQ